ncbi:MAG: Os1348 family NHLP clan protein [Chloroflexia bacterium]
MSRRALERLVGTALVDSTFRERLLNGGRREAIAAFDLTPEERAQVLSIRAEDLQEFARALNGWLQDREVTGSCARETIAAASYAAYGPPIL